MMGQINGDASPTRTQLPSILSMDVDGRVIRLDTFSKTLAPGFRLGWYTSHRFFQKHLERLTDDSVQCPNGFSQLFTAKLLSPAPQGWGFDGYINWCKKVSEDYQKKRDLFLNSLREELGEDWGRLATAETPISGMFVRLYVPVDKHPLFKKDDRAKGPKTNTVEIMDLLFDALFEKGLVLMPGKTFAHPRDDLDDIFDVSDQLPFVHIGDVRHLNRDAISSAFRSLGLTISYARVQIF
jgi:aromatic amino acid aminotransferase I / 2-aminoadipate transaminase